MEHPSANLFTLPQYGFDAEDDYSAIVQHNHFLFRVYTPKPTLSHGSDDVYFLAPKFSDQYNRSPDTVSDFRRIPESLEPVAQRAGYSDAVRHLDWTTRTSSPYISASFSFAWAIWEAMRRYRQDIKHEVAIAVIDAASVAETAVTARQLLRKGHSTASA